MFHPILDIIGSTYIWITLSLVVLFVVDWSFGYDKFPELIERSGLILEKYIPVEITPAPIVLTITGAVFKILEVLSGSEFCHFMATFAGIVAVGHILSVALIVVLFKGLKAFREKSIERRKKSLTKSE